MTKTIQIGIDLGTTNSELAIVDEKGEIIIVNNTFGDRFTPSVFGISKAGAEVVGKKAYEKAFQFASDEEIANNKAEIKRLMGTDKKTHFLRNNKNICQKKSQARFY